jgi:hypothetical protein
MAAGNDPFPREEVTGLAAFDNLQPVNSLGSMVDDDALDEESLPQQLHGSWSPSNDAGTNGSQALHQPVVPDTADHLFDDSTRGNWEDDAATRVITHGSDVSASSSTSLDMDWDDDEPPTQMRPNAMFEESPVGELSQWELPLEQSAPTEVDEATAESGPPPRAARPAHNDTLVGVPASPLPAAGAAPMAGGRPSPFPSTPRDPYDPRFANPLEPAFGQPLPHSLFDALKSGERRSWILVGSAIVGLLALGLLLRAIGGSSAGSSVMFSINPVDASVSVDGKELVGAASPYVVGELQAGKHTVVAKKAGFQDFDSSFELQSGESKTLPPIELVSSTREVGFALRSQPSGSSIWLDGNPLAETTPARLTGISAGIHRLQVKHEGYQDFELQMFVPEATVLQLPLAELAPLAQPATAVSGKDKLYAARADADSSADEPHSRWRRPRASADDVTSEEPRKSWHRSRASADDAPADEPRRSSRRSRTSADENVTADEPRSSSRHARAEESDFGAATSSAKTATLRINSRPWAQVSVDGHMVGNTPQQNLALTPGTHRISLVNGQMGMSKTISLSVKAGEVVTKAINLAD